MSEKQEMAASEVEALESNFLLYHFTTENYVSSGVQHRHTDFIDFLAVTNQVKVPFLPIIWQTARASVGLGGTSTIRRASLDAHTELAFKLIKDEEKASGKVSDILNLVQNEVRVLSHPQLRVHKNIVDLLGICWDIAGDGIVWPVLVFEKSHFGDLNHFTNIPKWMELNFAHKLQICVDIGNAISLMHSRKTVHGDLKPHNVLIFKDNDGFVAKVTDFGYSCQYSDPADTYSLPISEPWGAPEVDGSDKRFSLLEAKRADNYSYALLCAWILYKDQLQKIAFQKDSEFTTCPEVEASFVRLIKSYKNTLKLQDMILAFVDGDDLQPEDKVQLSDFFGNALASEPRIRKEMLWQSFKLLEQPRFDVDAILTVADAPAPEFKLSTTIEQYYHGDFRIRSYIAKCLEQRVSTVTRSVQTTNDTIQLAICYHIGFGVLRDESKVQELCGDQDLKKVHAAIDTLKDSSRELEHPLVRRLLAAGTLSNLHQNMQVQNVVLLRETEAVLLRELDDIGNSINDFGLKYLITVALVNCFGLQGRLDRVEKLESQMLSLYETTIGIDSIATITSKTNLAHIHLSQGSWDRALNAAEEAWQASIRILGPDDALTLSIMGNIAAIYNSLGDLGKAENLELELQDKRSRLLGKDHPDTLTSMNNGAAILLRQGRLHEALLPAKQTFEARRSILGKDHQDTVVSMSNLALIYQGLEQYDEAERLLLEAVRVSQRILGNESPSTLMCMANLALNYWHKDDLQEAEDLGLDVVAKSRYALGPNHPDTLTRIANLALVYESQGRLEEALEFEMHVLEKSRMHLGDSHPDTLMSMDNLANTHQNMKNLSEAKALLVEALSTRRRMLGEVHPETMSNTHKLLILLSQLGEEEEIGEIAERLAALSA